MRRVLQSLGGGPRRFERARQFGETAFATREPQQHSGLSFSVGGDVMRALDFECGRGNVFRLIEPPRQHDREHLGRVEQRLLSRLSFRKGVGQVDESDEKTPVPLLVNSRWVSDFHDGASFELDARLPLDCSD